MRKVWLDTDIGNDIDDSVTLAYLLRQPDCELLGVSTVSGQPYERAILADVICQAAGRDIPIYPGAPEPLLTPQRQGLVGQMKFLKDSHSHKTQFPEGRAIAAMYEAISQNPGEVTLLAVGPMTNVALLLKTHPDAAELLRDIVVMCGEFFGASAFKRLENEWNAYCDPYAAAILYGTEGVKLRSVGLDVTTLVVMSAVEIKERFSSPLLKVVYDFCGFEAGDRDGIMFHDPLAAVSIFHPELMGYRKGKISVELSAGRVIGRTYFDAQEDGLHEAAATVDKDAFFREYFAVTNA